MTKKMKDEIDEYDPWSTKSYLLTSGKFEKVFKDPIEDKEMFKNALGKIGGKKMAKDYKFDKEKEKSKDPKE